MNDHISKPISIEQLMATLTRWLPARSAAAAAAATSASAAAPAAAAAPELPAVLDGFNLEDGIKRVGGDRALFRRLLLQFHDHSATAASAIRAALAAGDRAQAKAEAHTLKGVAGTLSAKELYTAANALESALRKNAPSVDAEAAALEAAHGRVMRAIAALPRQEPAPGNGAGAPPHLPRLLDDLDTRLSTHDARALQALEAVKSALNGAHGTLVQELEELIGAYNFEQARRRLAQFASTLTSG